MISSVAFVSRQSIEEHIVPDPGTVVISITDSDRPKANIKDGFYVVLRMSFDDLYEEAIGLPVFSLPDAHSTEGERLKFYGMTLFDFNDADKLVRFIKLVSMEENPYRIVVHCEAGISRSAAVAMFIADRYAVDIDQANPDTSCANARVLRLLNKRENGWVPDKGMIDENHIKSVRKQHPYLSHLGHIF